MALFLLSLPSVSFGLPNADPVFFNLISEAQRGSNLYLAHSRAVEAINKVLATQENRHEYGPIVSDFGFATVDEAEKASLKSLLGAIERYYTITGKKTILSDNSKDMVDGECAHQKNKCEFIIYAHNIALYDGGESAEKAKITSASFLFVAGNRDDSAAVFPFPPSAHAVCQSLNPALLAVDFHEYVKALKLNVPFLDNPGGDFFEFDRIYVLTLPLPFSENQVTFETLGDKLKTPYQALVLGLDTPLGDRVILNGKNISGSAFLTAEIKSYLQATGGCASQASH